MAWLHATPKPDARSRRGKEETATVRISRIDDLKRKKINPSMPPNPAPHITDWLIEISLTEAAGMGSGPLSWGEIAAWQVNTCVQLEPWETRLIRHLSKTYIADATRIERATRGMVDVAAGTSNIVAFGNAASRELQTARIAMAGVEKAGERMVAQLERQNSTFGKTREEIRAMNAEFKATAAEQQGLTELAQRIRAEESALYDKEFAAARRATQGAEAAAEAKFDAATKVARGAEMEAQALREAD